MEIIPAVIPDTLETLRNKFSQVKGVAKKVQVDFVDGVYAPPVSWPFNPGQDAEFSKIYIGEEAFPFLEEFEMEADLFVREPEDFLKKLLNIGFRNFVLHLDSTDNLFQCLALAKDREAQVGIGIKPSGDFQKLEQFLNKCDFVQLMGNDKVGYNGVGLDETVLEKARYFHESHAALPLQIDIGVGFDTAAKIKEAGITRLVSGSAVFDSELPPSEAVSRLLNTQ